MFLCKKISIFGRFLSHLSLKLKTNMSNILIILICIVIVTYKVMTQKPKAEKAARPKPVFDFPEPSMEENETPAEEEQPLPHKEPVRYTQQMRKPKPMPSAPPAVKPQPGKKGISLRTRNEARKAFIYSEIFRRKY